MIKFYNIIDKSCSPSLIFSKENCSQQDQVNISPQKLTPNSKKPNLYGLALRPCYMI